MRKAWMQVMCLNCLIYTKNHLLYWKVYHVDSSSVGNFYTPLDHQTSSDSGKHLLQIFKYTII